MTTITFVSQFLLFTIVFLAFSLSTTERWLANTRWYRLAVVSVVILLVLAAALLRFEVGDVRLFSGAGWWFRQGVDFYWIDADHGQYPFFPFLIFFHAGANWLTESVPWLTFSFYLKLLEFVALGFIGWFIARHNQNQGVSPAKARRLQLQFLTSPITYATVVFHGQTDVILLAFLVASLVVWQGKPTWSRVVLAGLLFGASIATKTWSVVMSAVLLRYQRNVFKSAVFLAVAAIFILADVWLYTRLVFGSSIRLVLPVVLKAGGPVGLWGVSWWAKVLAVPFPSPLLVFGGLFGLGQLMILWRSGKHNWSMWFTVFMTTLLLYLTLVQWGIQYLFWILPWFFLTYSRHRAVERCLFWGLGSGYLFLNYFNVAADNVALIPPELAQAWGITLWLFFLIWFLRHWRQSDQ